MELTEMEERRTSGRNVENIIRILDFNTLMDKNISRSKIAQDTTILEQHPQFLAHTW